MASNLELKVRCPDARALATRIALARVAGAGYVRTMRQRDTYFVVARGRLKVRQWWLEHEQGGAEEAERASGHPARQEHEGGAQGAQLIAYARPDEEGTRLSDYLLAPCEPAEPTIAALARACDIRVIVEKRRTLYRYGATRIHFDTIERLGAFIELETVLQDGRTAILPEAHAEHAAVRAFLDIERLEAVAGSYSDLLLEEAP